MRVWAIASQKGGVGKTTTTAALGGLLAAWGFRTLMIDTDPHGSLSSWLRPDLDTVQHSSHPLFEALAEGRRVDPNALIVATVTEGLNLIPAGAALASLDRQSGRLGLALKRAVDELRRSFDYILIDCPPLPSVSLISALLACDCVIVPVQTEFLAIKGLERLQQTLDMVTRARSTPPGVVMVPTFHDRRTRASRDSLDILRRDHAEQLWSGVIPVDTRFREASSAGLPPGIFDPRARGVAAYSGLLEHLVQRRCGAHAGPPRDQDRMVH